MLRSSPRGYSATLPRLAGGERPPPNALARSFNLLGWEPERTPVLPWGVRESRSASWGLVSSSMKWEGRWLVIRPLGPTTNTLRALAAR